jgi:CDP-diacylglycerol---serine O-phosphatidyltransferase
VTAPEALAKPIRMENLGIGPSTGKVTFAMKLRDLMFVLPNLFTVSSIFCGFYAITLSSADASPTQLYGAAVAIFFGVFFDGFDGRVARLTKTQSAFGMELDSLADVITFGVAPALLVYRWALQPLGFIGLFISFSFAACGALRLARFNVLAQRSPEGGGSRFFVGMPIPFAACGLISVIIAFQASRGGPLPDGYRWPMLGFVVFLALLMVSTVRYRTFKDIKPSKRAAAVALGIIACGIVVATQIHPAWVIATYFCLYLISGLAESAVLLRRFLIERRATLDVIDDDDGDDDDVDEEVI